MRLFRVKLGERRTGFTFSYNAEYNMLEDVMEWSGHS